MVASPRQTNFPDHLVSIPSAEERLVPVAALFGANAAGKSNLVRALKWLQREVRQGHSRFMPFLFADPNRTSRFQLRFLQGEQVLEFGLTCRNEGIESEWLSTISSTGREKVIYERETQPDGHSVVEFAENLGGSSEKLEAFRVLGVKRGEAVLTKLTESLSGTELPAAVQAATDWFDKLVIISTDSQYMPLAERVHDDVPFRDYASHLFHRVDPTITEVMAAMKRVAIEHLPTPLRDRVRELDAGASVRVADLSVIKIDEANANVRDVVMQHEGPTGSRLPLSLMHESDGTLRLLHLAPSAFDAARDVVVVIDELDRSLHALLAREFVLEFLRRAAGRRSQLIFTTHETHLLDQDLLRRDEIWFVEKNRTGASELFSLDDFRVRNDLRLDRSYLQGRFGAIPPLGKPA